MSKGSEETADDTQTTPSGAPLDLTRRQFVAHAGAATAALAGAATLGHPAYIHAKEPITLKFQTTWTANDILYEFARDYGKTVEAISGGRLRLSVLPAGAVAGTLHMQEAVASGALDGGQSVAAYWYDTSRTYSLFATPPAFGWDANTLLGWVKYGGGQQLYEELVRGLKLNLVGFLSGPIPPQPLGWFTKEIRSVSDLKGIRYRTSGLAMELMRKLGVHVVTMPSSDIVPAMKRDALDAAEFADPSSDKALGFPEVAKYYILRSYHQPAECLETIFNKQRFESLPGEMQTILRYAAEAQSANMMWKSMDRLSRDLEAMENQLGVRVRETPESVLKAQLNAWDKVIAEMSRDPFAARVLASQRDWAKRVVGYQLRNDPSSRLAYDHFFPRERTTKAR